MTLVTYPHLIKLVRWIPAEGDAGVDQGLVEVEVCVRGDRNVYQLVYAYCYLKTLLS